MHCPTCQANIQNDSHFCSKCGSSILSSEESSFTRTIVRPVDELLSGTEVAGKYRVKEVIGKGGMGVVYKAEDLQLKRTVALKFLPSDLSMDEDSRQRFVLEAQAAASLSHPNICTIHEINEDQGKSFIAMEYIEGENLRDKIKGNHVSLEESLDIIIQLARGLDEAHRKGIIHRDIKSANIMLNAYRTAKIMDFGLAKTKGNLSLTRAGATLGTMAYMSPEQARGYDVDHRTDIWSLGVVFYELLSQQLPFTGKELYSVVHEEPKPVKSIKPDLPDELQRIINRTLEKDPVSRYSSASEMLKDLEDYRQGFLVDTAAPLRIAKFFASLRRPIIAIPAVCMLFVLIFAVFWMLNRQTNIRWAKAVALPEIERLVER
ncbi:protein kinase, partial [Acidobacteriota bacterium]